jgi:ribA/ribD-fused uncharacterized protein
MSSTTFIYFWKHDEIPYGVFCNWSPHSIQIDEITFATAEHALMFGKAILFKDEEASKKLITSKDPKEAKSIGRTVKDFDEQIWDQHKFTIMCKVLLAKVNQHKIIKDLLLTTQDATIVEASPLDDIWGIGLGAKKAALVGPSKWKGQNLLGKAWEYVRNEIKKQQS